MIKFTDRQISKIAIAVVIGGLSFAQYAHAADSSSSATDQQSAGMMRHEDGKKRVDDRIRMLHDQLNLTSKQEVRWNKLAAVMRKNEASVHRLIEEREVNESATAIGDLKSYEKITEAHEEGLKKLIPAFEDLYKGLTNEQKTIADNMFRKYEGRDERKDNDTSAPVKDNENETPMNNDSQENK